MMPERALAFTILPAVRRVNIWGRLGLLAGVTSLKAVFLAPYLRLPLSWDESVWAYIGWRVTQGGFLPYRDILDNKPLFAYLPFVLSELVLGHGWTVLRVASIVWGVSSTALLVAAMYSCFGFAPALVVGCVEAVFGASPALEGNYLLMSEQTVKPILIAFLLLYARLKRTGTLRPSPGGRIGWGIPFFLGLTVALASLTKQSYIMLLPLAPAQIWRTDKEGRMLQRLGMHFLGFLLPWSLLAGMYFAGGALWDLAYGLVGYNLAYIIGPPTVQYLIERSRAILSSSLPHWIVLLSALALGLWGVLVSQTRYLAGAIWALVLVGVVSLLAGGDRLLGHYYLFATFPIYLLLGPGLAALPVAMRRVASVSVLLMLLAAAPRELALAKSAARDAEPFPDASLVSFLNEHSSTGDGFFFDGSAFRYYYEFRVLAPSRYLSTDALLRPEFVDEKRNVMETLLALGTTWIVADSDFLGGDEEFLEFLETHYTPRAAWTRGEIYSLRLAP